MSAIATEDVFFAHFFRVPVPVIKGMPLDRVSLLACQRQGIEPEDLLPAPASFFEGSPTKETAEVKERAFEQRRKAKIAIVEQERQVILDVLMQPVGYRLSIPQTQLHAQLLQQGPDAQHAHVTAESDAVDQLLARESDHQRRRDQIQKAIRDTQERGQLEVEYLRQQQLRFIQRDLEIEQKKNEILHNMDEADRHIEKMQTQRRAEIQRQMQREAAERKAKALKLKQKNESQFQRKKAVIQEKAYRRDKNHAEREEEKRKLIEQRHVEMEEAMKAVKARCELVKQDAQKKCELMREEQSFMMELRDQRKQNLSLRMETSRELRRIQAQQRENQVQAYMLMQKEKDDAYRQEVLQREHEERERVEAARETLHHTSVHISEEERAKMEQVRLHREEKELRRQMKIDKMLQRAVEKESHVRKVEEEKKVAAEVLAEFNEQRHQNHIDNMKRLRRVNDYRQMVKDKLLEETLAHERQQKRHEKEMALRLQRERQRISEDKQRLMGVVERLRMKQAHEGTLASSPTELINKELGKVFGGGGGSAKRPNTRGGSTEVEDQRREGGPSPGAGGPPPRSAPAAPASPQQIEANRRAATPVAQITAAVRSSTPSARPYKHVPPPSQSGPTPAQEAKEAESYAAHGSPVGDHPPVDVPPAERGNSPTSQDSTPPRSPVKDKDGGNSTTRSNTSDVWNTGSPASTTKQDASPETAPSGTSDAPPDSTATPATANDSAPSATTESAPADPVATSVPEEKADVASTNGGATEPTETESSAAPTAEAPTESPPASTVDAAPPAEDAGKQEKASEEPPAPPQAPPVPSITPPAPTPAAVEADKPEDNSPAAASGTPRQEEAEDPAWL